ncbi:ARM repeat superfamily protein [Hibiscus syriacus]|uniref:ARM repeat superfamily protein n=1 Tax=Hibiscus syriacus TaxID=106335 RepID=A0A6A3BS41_HIBSY|nr:trihelix transcription factor ASIL2-like [Hibiscus syriacus]KAE8717862.1 ARM repeat superfamily protein [Hibiscus syriacus]
MDKETNNQETPSLISNNKQDSSPKKHPGSSAVTGGGGGSNDRLKRDEWSEGAVSSLLEAYESKWVLRNRAKLKGHDWEDVARYVSARVNCTKSPKTQTQCKNKIESMKKRYRSESATAEGSSWPLYQRLDLLLRGNAAVPPPLLLPPPPGPIFTSLPLTLPEASTVVVQQQPPNMVAQPPTLAPYGLGTAQNSHGSNGFEKIPKDDGTGTKVSDHLSDKVAMETDSSTPDLYNDEEKKRSKKLKTKISEKKKRRKREEYWETGESLRVLAETILKSEETKMETLKEIEKMRVEAETKRSEMDLQRTEIIAKTQLEIAKLFAGSSKGIDPALRIGRS